MFWHSSGFQDPDWAVRATFRRLRPAGLAGILALFTRRYVRVGGPSLCPFSAFNVCVTWVALSEDGRTLDPPPGSVDCTWHGEDVLLIAVRLGTRALSKTHRLKKIFLKSGLCPSNPGLHEDLNRVPKKPPYPKEDPAIAKLPLKQQAKFYKEQYAPIPMTRPSMHDSASVRCGAGGVDLCDLCGPLLLTPSRHLPRSTGLVRRCKPFGLSIP